MAEVGTYASKAVNQYRGRDMFAYLALRYCFENSSARIDKWAEENAIHVVMGTKSGRYLRSYQFKGLKPDGTWEHRELMIPGPAEATAEAVLLAECSKHWNAWGSGRVFSYVPTAKSDRKSYYVNYIEGLRARQRTIALACRDTPDGHVLYVDIKKFYPSISPVIAEEAWHQFCADSDVGEDFRSLGEKLISNHALATGGKSILTGPMFSHFLANLVMTPVDHWSENLPAKYVRYVDDITLIGQREDILSSVAMLEEKLASLGFDLHPSSDKKTVWVSASEWLESADDFQDSSNTFGWMKLVGNVKRLLIFDPKTLNDLADAFLSAEIRLPLPDYAVAVKEASAFEKIRQKSLWWWLRIRSKNLTPDSIVRDALKLRDRLFKETCEILSRNNGAEGFERKRVVSKLRYRLGRLLFIAKRSQIQTLLAAVEGWEELTFHAALMRVVLSNDCSEVIAMGSNVAQSAAQLLKASLETAQFSKPVEGEAASQGLATFVINGVSVSGSVRSTDHPLLKFSAGPVDHDLMSVPRGLVQDLSCLHGLGPSRNAEIVKLAFELGQEIILDALADDYGYST